LFLGEYWLLSPGLYRNLPLEDYSRPANPQGFLVDYSLQFPNYNILMPHRFILQRIYRPKMILSIYCWLALRIHMNRIVIVLLVMSMIQIETLVWSGDLCVSSVGKEQGELSAVNPRGGSRKYSIQIDQGKIHETLEDKALRINDLDEGKKHLVRIRLDGKQVESFWFTFEKHGANELCLWFNDFYRTWSVWPLKDAKHLCKCESASQQVVQPDASSGSR
jgi:hypothetical protein